MERDLIAIGHPHIKLNDNVSTFTSWLRQKFILRSVLGRVTDLLGIGACLKLTRMKKVGF